MTEYTNNRAQAILLVNKTGEKALDGCCTHSRGYTHLSCAQLCVCTKHSRKISQRGPTLCILCELKCHLTAAKKGSSALNPVMPHQSAVVFAVLVGQVSNGGCNARTEELLPLVKVALMDFFQELMVSAHIDIRRDELI